MTEGATQDHQALVRRSALPEDVRMPVDIKQHAAQICSQTVSPDIMVRVSLGADLDKMSKAAASQSIAAAEAFARAREEQMALPAAPGA